MSAQSRCPFTMLTAWIALPCPPDSVSTCMKLARTEENIILVTTSNSSPIPILSTISLQEAEFQHGTLSLSFRYCLFCRCGGSGMARRQKGNPDGSQNKRVEAATWRRLCLFVDCDVKELYTTTPRYCASPLHCLSIRIDTHLSHCIHSVPPTLIFFIAEL